MEKKIIFALFEIKFKDMQNKANKVNISRSSEEYFKKYKMTLAAFFRLYPTN